MGAFTSETTPSMDSKWLLCQNEAGCPKRVPHITDHFRHTQEPFNQKPSLLPFPTPTIKSTLLRKSALWRSGLCGARDPRFETGLNFCSAETETGSSPSWLHLTSRFFCMLWRAGVGTSKVLASNACRPRSFLLCFPRTFFGNPVQFGAFATSCGPWQPRK